jgi:glycosyltransferase involved in cell wall biosynthesis
VPWPANYGGVVDLFYKIQALHQLGVNIYLHCYTADGVEQPGLNKYCAEVNYYRRSTGFKGVSLKLPYIVQSRSSAALLTRLQQDTYPVLLEGIHCTYHLFRGALAGRKVLVRLHNVEYEYYHRLAGLEKKLLKKIYYNIESRLLKKYEQSIAGKAEAVFMAVSEQDADLYKNLLGAKSVHFLPVFIPHTMVTAKEGKGHYCLYHGNLAVNENAKAAEWLLEKVFSRLELPLVIAGRNPSAALEKLAHKHQHTCIATNPSDAEMQDLIARAQVNILPSFNNTGVKLKLVNAIFNGRHCLVNAQAVAGSGLEQYCHTATNENDFIEAVSMLFEVPFTEDDIEIRQGIPQRLFNNLENARKLISLLH